MDVRGMVVVPDALQAQSKTRAFCLDCGGCSCSFGCACVHCVTQVGEAIALVPGVGALGCPAWEMSVRGRGAHALAVQGAFGHRESHPAHMVVVEASSMVTETYGRDDEDAGRAIVAVRVHDPVLDRYDAEHAQQ